MHIIIGVITAAAGLIWALYRLQSSGVDLNSFNPFFWARRRRWEKQVGTKPLHRIENPMEATAVLVVAMAQLEGIVSREHKKEIVGLFVDEFGIREKTAVEYCASSSYLLKEVLSISGEVKNILNPTKAQFESRHKESLISMMAAVSQSESVATKEQLELLGAVKRELSLVEQQAKKW